MKWSLFVVLVLMTGCAQPRASAPVSAAPTPVRPTLERVTVQTDTAIHVALPSGGIEVLRAVSWPRLFPPVTVCLVRGAPRPKETTAVAHWRPITDCQP